MGRQLNGWQRIGVVASLLWIAYVLGVAATNPRTFRTAEFTEPATCLEAEAPDPSRKTFTLDEAFGCAEGKLIAGRHVPARFEWDRFLFALLGPVAAGWVLAYLAVAATRWIVAGFRRKA